MGSPGAEDSEKRPPGDRPPTGDPPKPLATLYALSTFIRELEERNPYAVPEARGHSAEAEPYRLSDRIAAAATGEIDVDSAIAELRANQGFVLTPADRAKLDELLDELERSPPPESPRGRPRGPHTA